MNEERKQVDSVPYRELLEWAVRVRRRMLSETKNEEAKSA